MSAFLKMGDLKGESTDKSHTAWILIESVSAGIVRSIPSGAKDQQRSRGQTTAHDIVVVRQADSSSTSLMEASATGKYQKEVDIHLCSIINGKQEPYLKIKLDNVIISGYNFHGVASGNPLPTEEITLNYTKAEWTYVKLDPNDGSNKGNVVGKYSLGEHAGS